MMTEIKLTRTGRQAGSDDAICTGDEGQGRARNLNE